ncbi:MAG: hypothetical protein WBD46_03575 [Acidobacteriaceae bacterium]
MVIPIDAVRTGAGFELTACWAKPATEEPEVPDWNHETEPARGVAWAMLLSLVIWVGLIVAGRALVALL